MSDEPRLSDEPVVLRWYWRYHTLYCELESSVIDAVHHQQFGEDYGEISGGPIEVDGRELSPKEYKACLERLQAEDEGYAAARPEPPPVVARVDVRRPDGTDWAEVDYFHDLKKAEAFVQRLTNAFGADRVRLVPTT